MGSIDYTYDVLNRRVIREGDNQYEAYVYDGNQVVADLGYYRDLLRTYVWGPGIDNLMSFTDYSTATPTTYYAVKDHQNSVIAMVNASGSVVESYEYDAYGNTKIFNASSTELTTSAIGNRYMFQGREYDSATGLYYFRARWYDPDTGRWLSKDPIGIEGGLNQYEFCSSNPVNVVDPHGEFGWFGAIVGGIAGAVSGAISGSANGGGAAGAIAGGVTGLFAGAAVGAINLSASSAVGAMVGGAVGGAIGSTAAQLMTTGTVNPGAVVGAAVTGAAVAGVGVLAVASIPAATASSTFAPGGVAVFGKGVSVAKMAQAGVSIVAGAGTALGSNAGGMMYDRIAAGKARKRGCR